jgi:hypothetical protein
MAHFAKVENGVVTQVIVVGNDDILDTDGNESEAVGKAFIKSIGLDGDWWQTSYNGNPVGGVDRGPYAGIGYSWDGDKFAALAAPETAPEETTAP